MPGGVDIPLPVEIAFPVRRLGRERTLVNAALVGGSVLILHSVLSALDLQAQFTQAPGAHPARHIPLENEKLIQTQPKRQQHHHRMLIFNALTM